MDIRLPSLGEGVGSATVVAVSVSVGDRVERDQQILEIETEKAVAPVPAPGAGVVSKIHVKPGDKVSVGAVLVTLAGDPRVLLSQDSRGGAAEPARSVSPVARTDVYVYSSPSGTPPPAGPAARRLAQDLGVDLTRVRGTAAGGRITTDDIKTYVRTRLTSAAQSPGVPATARSAPSIDFSKWGPVTRKPLTAIRRTIAEKMLESWQTIPHVTQCDEADITDLLAMKKKYDARFEKNGAKLTVTVFVVKAVVEALKRFPIVNASLDAAAGELVLKQYYHVGVAVDTEAGLMVPVLKNADKKNLLEIARELGSLAERARTRKVTLEELSGGTFSISNLGGIAGTTFTPIIRAPEVAILGVGRGFTRLAWRDSRPEPRVLLPLSLSYDHRVVDGADGARFIAEVSKVLLSFDEASLKGVA